MDLTEPEIRVLGCLIEKQRTVPDQYPLSLNSLRLACNQSTNREPVVQYDEQTIRDALHRLERRGFARFASGAGSRAAKYRHLLAEALPMSDSEQALMCVLMLRGAQTPGELKQRSERLHPFAGLAEVHETLDALIEHELVARLERRPGQKEERYMQLLGAGAPPADAGAVNAGAPSAGAPSAGANGHAQPAYERPGGGLPTTGDLPTTSGSSSAGSAELEALTERVERLESELAELRAAISERVS